MKSPELVEIDASMRAIIQRAYDLGRRDALKKVVDVLGAEDKSEPAEPLALMAPESSSSRMDAPNGEETVGMHMVENDRPWWARPLR